MRACAPLPRRPQHRPERRARSGRRSTSRSRQSVLVGSPGAGEIAIWWSHTSRLASGPVSGMPLSRKIRTGPVRVRATKRSLTWMSWRPIGTTPASAELHGRRRRRAPSGVGKPVRHRAASRSSSGPYSSATARGECRARHAASASQSITSFSRMRMLQSRIRARGRGRRGFGARAPYALATSAVAGRMPDGPSISPRTRCAWSGASTASPGSRPADIVVVVDVLRFSTTVIDAVERGDDVRAGCRRPTPSRSTAPPSPKPRRATRRARAARVRCATPPRSRPPCSPSRSAAAHARASP